EIVDNNEDVVHPLKRHILPFLASLLMPVPAARGAITCDSPTRLTLTASARPEARQSPPFPEEYPRQGATFEWGAMRLKNARIEELKQKSPSALMAEGLLPAIKSGRQDTVRTFLAAPTDCPSHVCVLIMRVLVRRPQELAPSEMDAELT